MTGKILKEARKILGLSQEEMAAKIYVSFPTYNGYENGKNIPKNKHAVISNVLKEASLIEEEKIHDIVLKKDSKDILTDILFELKAIRDEQKEMKDLINEVLSDSKVNQFSATQLDILKTVAQNLNSELKELKKADYKSAKTKQ